MAPKRPSTPPVNFNRKRQNLTRYQERLIRKTFPFLELPAELRNNVYEFCIDFNLNDVKAYFDKYYKRLHNSKKPGNVRAPPPCRTAPSVFLINRQIYNESVVFLQKCSATFEHGLFDARDVNAIVSENVLRNLTSLTITDKGHPLLERKILCQSWHGYIRLFENLARILPGRHNLKELTISLTDQGLKLHFDQCWERDWSCGFRESLNKAFEAMKNIRGVGNVILEGIPEDIAVALKSCMESKPPVTFHDLPREPRDLIYGDAMDWSDVSIKLAKTLATWTDKSKPPTYPQLTTPTVLLLNHQIHDEAIEVLYKKALNIICPVKNSLQKIDQVPDITRFINIHTLQNVSQLNLGLESWEWMYALEKLLPVLSVKHNLTHFELTFFDSLKERFLTAGVHAYPDSTLHLALSGLAKIRGVKKVIIHGDLPGCYTKPLIQIMQTAFGVATGAKMEALRGDGMVVELDDSDA